MDEPRISLADDVVHQILARIKSGEWYPGMVIAGQRDLMQEFEVSRVPLREALSMLKALGILEIQQGRRTVVRQMDTGLIEQLFPLVFRLEGQKSFTQIFELRLAIESRTAYLAAMRRSEEDLKVLTELVHTFRDEYRAESTRYYEADHAFHLRIAESTGNPLFSILLKTISGFVVYSQVEGCRGSVERRRRAVQSHESILEAIEDRDAQRACVEMESHLRYSASKQLKSESQKESVNGSG